MNVSGKTTSPAPAAAASAVRSATRSIVAARSKIAGSTWTHAAVTGARTRPSPAACSRSSAGPRRSATWRRPSLRFATVRLGSGSSRANVPAGAGWSTPSMTIVASPDRTMNTSSWSLSTSVCSGIVSPGGSSTTFIPNDCSPSDLRASAHLGNGRSKSSMCTIVKPVISAPIPVRDPSRPLPRCD